MKPLSYAAVCAAIYCMLFVRSAFGQATPAASAASAASATANSSLVLSPEDKRKLEALDAALKSGALTREEYEAKKNVLDASARTRAATASKLKSLDQAYKDGVLTQQEYERKKAELSGIAQPPANPSARPAAGTSEAARPIAQPALTNASWTTHNDASGFAVDVPPAWTVSKDAATGRIVLRGTRSEQVVIWPLTLQKVRLNQQNAGVLLQRLARSVDAQMPWSGAQFVQNVARVLAAGGPRSGAAVLSWANGTSGTSAYLYCLEAPANTYRASTESFVGILKSFHIVQDPSMKGLAGFAALPAALAFETWTDPRENAFSASVPQGWRVIGGAYRLSVTDVRYAVAMGSPDGRVRATIGDASIPLFELPNQMLAMAGLREGNYYGLGDGTKMEIRRYIPGPQFARIYVENYVTRQCSGAQVTSNNARPDLAAAFMQSARNEGVPNVYLTAGDVSFTCSLNGNPVQGKYVAGTAEFASGGGGIWSVYRLYGYLATAGQEQVGEKVVTQTLQSWRFNPQWEAQQRSAQNAAVQQDNMRSQQIQSRALQAIAEDQRQTSDTIMKGWEQRQKIYDEIDRRRENAILGTLDVIDPETGVQYKVSNYGDYHYMSNDGYIYSTNSPDSPSPDLREMITLP